MAGRNKYSKEVRERAVRMVFEQEGWHGSRWAMVRSISSKIGCLGQALRKRVQQTEIDSGSRPGLSTDEATRIRDLERENRELRQANKILRKASACFGA